MIIHANVRSKAMKKGATKKQDLRDCCGALHLDSENVYDLKLLTAMYSHCFGVLERNSKGSIKVFDAEGKEVIHYYYAAPPSVPAGPQEEKK